MGGDKPYTNAFVKKEQEDDLETKLNLMINTMEKLADHLQRIEAKVDSILISDKDKKIPLKPTFNTSAYTHRYVDQPPQSGIYGGGIDQTIIVKGFDLSLPEDYIKNELSKYFSSCGEITSVIVPRDLVTGAVIGCAYIHLKEGVENALKLNGSFLGGWNLVVEKATQIINRRGRFGPPGRGDRGGQWPYPYSCNGLGHCGIC